MKRFRYLSDPLFIGSCLLYAVNRWLVNPSGSMPVLHNWFNDFLLIPCALPPLLLLHRRLGWRNHDRVPGWTEIAAHLVGWTVLFEVIGPHLASRATADPIDALAYAAGALFAFLWWNRPAPREAHIPS